MKRNSLRWFLGGLVAILIGVIGFELIWLPAPWVMTPNLEWIEVINWLYYGLIIIPICWIIGAYYVWRESDPSHAKHKLTKILSFIILVCSGIMALSLVIPLAYLEVTIVSGLSALILIWIYMFISIAKTRAFKLFIIYIVVVIVLLCPTGYNVTYPAMTMNMNSYAHISSEKKSENIGWIDGVLVFDRPAFPIDWVFSKLISAYHLEKQAENEPSIGETYSQVVQMKNDANVLAAAIAWETANRGEAITFNGIMITAIAAGAPADGILQAGDLVLAINEQAVHNRTELMLYMNSYVAAGDTVKVKVQRAGETEILSVGTISAEDETKRPLLGIAIEDNYSINVPLHLNLKQYIAHFGGPSHGAMLTLALYDQLTEEDITGGLHIAGTGTIEVDGTVGMVGGIPQKAYAVARTDADVFFVPVAAYEMAKEAAPELNIVPVQTFDEILVWLNQHSQNNEITG